MSKLIVKVTHSHIYIQSYANGVVFQQTKVSWPTAVVEVGFLSSMVGVASRAGQK